MEQEEDSELRTPRIKNGLPPSRVEDDNNEDSRTETAPLVPASALDATASSTPHPTTLALTTSTAKQQPHTSSNSSSSNALRRVTRVSRHAALTTKQAVWDSNELSIEAAISAVDQWEAGYNGLRSLIVQSVSSAKGVYHAAKEGAGRLEHGLLMPVRDWILLPAFGVSERIVGETVSFLQSEAAHNLAEAALEKLREVPVVGETVLAPSVCFSAMAVQRTWDVLQYPIPSREQVRSTVDWSLNTTKWALASGGREVILFCKRADANITRTLSHTQWKVLGSGPYATLEDSNKAFVIDHVCERYFSLPTALARYELAAHIKRHNRALYYDLVFTGLLKERGGNLTERDVWLTFGTPVYFTDPYLLDGELEDEHLPRALWFRWPHVNGKTPAQNAPWVCFRSHEQDALETKYRTILRERSGTTTSSHHDCEPRHPTVAQWYSCSPDHDAVVDQQRHSVSFYWKCPKCRVQHDLVPSPLIAKGYNELCDACAVAATPSSPSNLTGSSATSILTPLPPPPIAMRMRPNFWRFYGPGDPVVRAVWLLDTNSRHGLQPLDDEACCILEDAYRALRYLYDRGSNNEMDEESLLTVEVPCADGMERLVQFSSLTQATVIQKGLGAFALFKRRVYRGSWLSESNFAKEQGSPQTMEEAQDDVENDSNHLSVRSLLELPHQSERVTKSIAVPPERLEKRDMAKQLRNFSNENPVEHIVLIVHGIGEMMRSIDLFGLHFPNLNAVCDSMRSNHSVVQQAHFPNPEAMGRVEYLPVEWHETFSILTHRRTSPGSSKQAVMISDISLRTIPNMREFANDTLMDVLFFMSPEHHDIIIDVVTREMNTVVDKFRKQTGFNGSISVIGHSLGSVISWDILNHQVRGADDAGTPSDTASVYSSHSLSERGGTPELTTSPNGFGTSPATPFYPQLDFSVKNFFLLGSPVPVFLMIRNQRSPLSEDFSLAGCNRVFNIFHPYDPVAYRIEPCIDTRNADYEPSIITHGNGGLRVQYRTRRLWRKLVETTTKTQRHVADAFEQSLGGFGLADMTTDDDTMSESSESHHGITTGLLNEGRRIDYQLQEKEIESANEYVSALAAHSSYWMEKDLSLFIAHQICLATLEQAIDLDTEAITPVAMQMFRNRRKPRGSVEN